MNRKTAKLVRFGVSVEQHLVAAFDRWMRTTAYTNRSEAIRDLMREQLVRQRWTAGGAVAGAVTIVYDHHRRDLVGRIVDLQHDFQDAFRRVSSDLGPPPLSGDHRGAR